MTKAIHKNLTARVLTAIVIGVLIGHFFPKTGEALQPLGEGFIRLVKMVVGPIIFLTIVVGIATMGDLKKVGRVGGKALLYFEVVTTIALAIGLIVATVVKPGHGIHATPNTAAEAQQISGYAKTAEAKTTADFLLHIIPDNIVGAFAGGDLLQILFFSVLFGCAIAALGMNDGKLIRGMEQLTEVMFKVVAIIMKVAPLGALGAMAYTIGHHGIGSLLPLAKLMACVYLTMAVFVFVVLGTVCRLFGFSVLRYLAFIREEILLVLGTSSSESALPRMIQKCEHMGCNRGVVGMVIPAGYSFNLDGTSIYLSIAFLFLAQAYDKNLTLTQQLSVMGVLMLTSKGAAAVTGGGFVTLAATLSATHVLPVEGLALLLGVDRFMSEARAITNVIGNGIAAICVSKWEGEFDAQKFERAMSGQDTAIN